MTIVEATKTCFAKYVTFSGRATGPEFWKFVLFVFLIQVLLVGLNSVVFGPTITQQYHVTVTATGEQTEGLVINKSYNGGWFALAFQIITLLPLLAVTWRRMHDIGRPGWHILIPPAVIAISFLTVFLNVDIVPVDKSAIPQSVEMPDTLRVPKSAAVLGIAWFASLTSVVWGIVWLSLPSAKETGKPDGGQSREGVAT